MSTESFVKVENVSKSFGENQVLTNVSLDVAAHDVVCLIGASGSGKSTLLRCINLLEKVDAGSITFDGQNITNGKLDVNELRQHIGIVFQAFNLFPHMTVLQNVTLSPRKTRGLSKKQADDARLRAARPHRAAREGRGVPRPALGRAAAARRHRARARHGPEAHAARRDHERARSPARERGAAARARPQRDRHDDDHRHARDELRARGRDKICFLDAGVILEEGPPSQLFGDPQEQRTRAFLSSILAAGRM